MMNRRAFIGTLAGGLLAAPLAAEAQRAGKVPRIGFLRSGPPPQAFVEGFQQGLRELGYVEGQNIIIEYRFADRGTAEQLADLGSELLRLKVDVILASATPAALAAKNLTRTVPIVFAGVLDPVDSGVVSALSRAGRQRHGHELHVDRSRNETRAAAQGDRSSALQLGRSGKSRASIVCAPDASDRS